MKTAAKKRKLGSVRRERPVDGSDAWSLLRSGNLTILQAKPLTGFPWLLHGFSTRPGGASLLPDTRKTRRVLNLGLTDWDEPDRVHRNRKAFVAALGASDMKLVTLRQIHSTTVHSIRFAPSPAPKGDALVTRTPGLLLAVQTADCIPILLVDPEHKAVSAVHAGWRGTLERIVQKALGQMAMTFGSNPASMLAVLGPGIGPCCYEVGPEVAQSYAGQFASATDWFQGPFDEMISGEPSPLPWLSPAPPGHEPPPVRARLDLIAANRWQLLDVGLSPSNIVSAGLCTACHADLLFSYRRERSTGRMMAVIGLRADT